MKKRRLMVVVLLIILLVSFANTTVYAKSCEDALGSCLIDAVKIGIFNIDAGIGYAAFCAAGYTFCKQYK